LNKRGLLDELDMRILMELQRDCRKSLQEIANYVDAPLSTVYYRVKRLEKKKVISGYSATINPEKLELDYNTVISVWTEFEPDNYNKIGAALSEVPGVWAVYSCLGGVDFFVLARAKDKPEFLKILDDMMKIEGITKIDTHIAARIIKEDPRLNIRIGPLRKLKKWPGP
jgi:Lrp/AsnC family leucine-responsive transcriptional regulator